MFTIFYWLGVIFGLPFHVNVLIAMKNNDLKKKKIQETHKNCINPENTNYN